MDAGGHQARDVRHIGHHDCADAIGGGADPCEINDAWIGAGSDDDDLRLP